MIEKIIKDRADVHIITLNYKRLDCTKELLKSLRKNISWVDYIVTIVNNDDDEEANEWIKKQEDCNYILDTGNLGFSRWNNLAFEKVKSKYTLFINNDITVNKGFLKKMIESIEKEEINAAVGCKIVHPETKKIMHAGIIFNTAGLPLERWKWIPNNNKLFVNEYEPMNACTAACLLVRSKIFDFFRWFDPTYVNGWEDNDFNMRMRERGYQIIYNWWVLVYHLESASPWRHLKEKENVDLFIQRWIKTGKVFKITSCNLKK